MSEVVGGQSVCEWMWECCRDSRGGRGGHVVWEASGVDVVLSRLVY